MQTVKPLDISAIDIIPRPTQGKTALPRTTDEVWTFPADTHQVLFVCAAITKMTMMMMTLMTTMVAVKQTHTTFFYEWVEMEVRELRVIS